MSVGLPLDKMSTEEKLQVMEALWAHLSRFPDAMPSPDWHGDVLRDREERVRSGKEQFINWETAKKQLRNRAT